MKKKKPAKKLRRGRLFDLANKCLQRGRKLAIKKGLLPNPPLTPDKISFLNKWAEIEHRLFVDRLVDRIEQLEIIVTTDPVFDQLSIVIAAEYVDALTTFAIEAKKRMQL